MKDEDELFRREIADVKPLSNNGRAALNKTGKDTGDKAYARQAAVREQSQDGELQGPVGAVSDDFVEMVKPLDILSFKRPGIQQGVFKKLRLGKYAIDGRLDLHRKTITQARAEVFDFIRQAMSYDLRTVIILHGKGERSVERQAVLKSHVAKWLTESPDVLAYHSAQRQHGGTGAVYVLLKKSEKLKAKNREEHGTRG